MAAAIPPKISKWFDVFVSIAAAVVIYGALQKLLHSPIADFEEIDLGRYELPRRSGESHLYRVGHPLAAWVIEQAKNRQEPFAQRHHA